MGEKLSLLAIVGIQYFVTFLLEKFDCSYSIYRAHFLEKMWNCCSSLFQLGQLERRDAYQVLSLYFLSFYELGGDVKLVEINMDEELDIRGNSILWEQVKIGLVHCFVPLFMLSFVQLVFFFDEDL